MIILRPGGDICAVGLLFSIMSVVRSEADMVSGVSGVPGCSPCLQLQLG